MRFVAIALVLFSFPLLLSFLRQAPRHRPTAFGLLGLMLFCGDAIRIGGTLMAWPMWTGISKGMEISPVDSLALALLFSAPKLPFSLPLKSGPFFFGLMLFASMLTSYVPMASLFVVWQFLRALLIFAIVGLECHRPEVRKGLTGGLALGLLLQALYVVPQKAAGVVQATGTMYHQNVLGLMVELALLPLLACLLSGDRRKVILVGVAAGFVVVAGGGSRGAIAFSGGGAIILLLLSAFRGINSNKGQVFGLALLGMMVAGPIAAVTLKDRFGSRSITEQDDQRPAFERAARAMANDHPFGVGANLYVSTANTKGYAERAGVAWNFANRSAPVHNAYLLSRAETGWLGEISLILLLIVPVLRGLKFAYSERRSPGGEIALGSAVALGLNAIHNNYEFAFYSYNVTSLALLNMGLIAAQLRGRSLQRIGSRKRIAPPVRKLEDSVVR